MGMAIWISLLQDVQPTPPAPKPPLIKVDRGGGGGARYPAFEIADFIAAAGTFVELPHEDSVARASRRALHIARELGRLQRERQLVEQSMAQGLLLGVELQRRVQEDTAQAVASEVVKPIPQAAVPPIAVAAPVVHQRGERGAGSAGIGPWLFLGGLVLGLAIARRR